MQMVPYASSDHHYLFTLLRWLVCSRIILVRRLKRCVYVYMEYVYASLRAADRNE